MERFKRSFMNKSITLLGGNSFFGKTLYKYLVNKGYQVLVTDIKTNNEENFAYADVLNLKEVKSAVKNAEIVINCTGQITNPINQCIRLNSSGVENIINAINEEGKRLVHFSSVAVYGNSVSEVNEMTNPNPETVYGAAKYFSEILIEKRLHKKNYIILRLSNLYGDNQEKGLIPYLIKSFNNSEPLDFDNDGTLTRYFLHVEDAASIVLKLLSHEPPSGIYNLIGPDQFDIKGLIDLCKEITNKNIHVNYSPVKLEKQHTRISDEKLKILFQPKYSSLLKTFLQKKLLKH